MYHRKLQSIRRIADEAAKRRPSISFNPGTMTDPLPAVERAVAAFRRSVRGNPVSAYDKCRAVLGDLRQVAAEVLGGQPCEWALADGHTATIDRVASVLAEQLGATKSAPVSVVSSENEHVGGVGAFSADPRFKVKLVDPEQLADTRAQVYFLSQLTYDTNRDLTDEIKKLAVRGGGAGLGTFDAPIVVVDGTQAVGQIDVNVAELGAHAYLASAHKWLGGPHGSGLLYLRSDILERWPTPFRAGEPLCADVAIGRWEPRGGQDFSRVAGIAAALRAYQCHAVPGSGPRARFLARIKDEVGDAVHVLSVSAPHGRAAAIAIPGMDVYPVYRRLVDRGVSVKCIKRSVCCEETGGGPLEVLRVGFPWWLEDADADRAVDTLIEVLQQHTNQTTQTPVPEVTAS